MTATQGNVQQLMTDAAVDASVNMTAQMAETNPELLKALFTRSAALLPEPAQTFYARLAENPEARQKLIDDFKAMVGPLTESLSSETAQATGTTAEQAGATLATTYPAVAQTLANRNTAGTEAGFAEQLKILT